MSKLTDSCRGKPCKIRTPWCQDAFPHETTVPAHAPRGFGRGTSRKAPDWAIADACHACHDAVDGRAHIHETTACERLQMWTRGFYETMERLIDDGLVVLK